MTGGRGFILQLVVIALGVFSITQASAAPAYTAADIHRFIQELDQFKISSSLSPDHPDTPVMKVIAALQADKAGQSQEVIGLLEPILPQIQYRPLSIATGDRQSALLVGAVGSFDLWRELTYLLLGRAYYKEKRNEQATLYFGGITPESPFGSLALIEKGWALIRLERREAIEKNIDELSDRRLNEEQKNEVLLQRSFLEMYRENLKKSIELAGAASFDVKTSRSLAILRLRVLAQAHLRIFLSQMTRAPFPEKVNFLNRIVKIIEAAPSDTRDSEFSYLAAETYWHVASAYRVENPTAHRKTWMGALDQANAYLTPWVDRMLKGNEILLSEDALFLSVAVLWEQERFEPAIPRLLAIPKFFPNGDYKIDTYQLLADYYYDSKSFDRAVQYYAALARTASVEKASYGVYKAAWAFYNQKDKWKALRHLERLVEFHRKEIDSNRELPEGSLSAEAEKDMLIVMAELLNHQDAVRELRYFKFNKDKWIEVREKLAFSYKSIGRYEDSIAAWGGLLSEAGQTPQAFEWLDELLKTLLAAGRRDLIASNLDHYLPSLPKQDNEDFQKEHKELQDKIVTLILTIHKEAKKTDDQSYWKAVDLLYGTFVKYYPNSKNGDVWYFGAQRKEKIGQKLEAVRWYQKAAEIKEYDNSEDAGISVLQIVKVLQDELSLKKTNDEAGYGQLATFAQWYIDHFPNRKERGLAEFLLVEAAYKSGKFELAHQYLLRAFKRDGFTEEHQKQYLTYNGWLYKDKHWETAHTLSSELLDFAKSSKVPDSTGFTKKLAVFKQETAFQNAYAYDNVAKRDQVATQESIRARQWYRRAVETAGDSVVSIKAWHNLLMTFVFPQESDAFLKSLEEFQESFGGVQAKNKDEAELLHKIYSRAAEAWEGLGNPPMRATQLATSANFMVDAEKSDEVRWEALTLFGTYYQLKKMKSELETVIKKKSNLLNDGQNRLALARLLFWNGDYEGSWSLIQPLTEARETDANVWILLSNLYFYAKKEKSDIFRVIQKFLMENRKRLANNTILQPLWAGVSQARFDERQFEGWLGGGGRNVAGLLPDFDEKQPSHINLRKKVDAVGRILKESNEQQQKLKQISMESPPQVALEALCYAPNISLTAASLLNQLKSPSVQSGQWPEFVKKLDSKVEELKTSADRQKSVCQKQMDLFAFMPPNRKVDSPLCDEELCFSLIPKSIKSVLELEAQWKKDPVDRLEKIYSYLKLGAWATAEYAAYSAPTFQERTILLGFIRLALGDTWNAAPLFDEANKDPKFSRHGKLFMARIAWRFGNKEYASRELAGVTRQGFHEWEKLLFDEMKVDLMKDPKTRSILQGEAQNTTTGRSVGAPVIEEQTSRAPASSTSTPSKKSPVSSSKTKRR